MLQNGPGDLTGERGNLGLEFGARGGQLTGYSLLRRVNGFLGVVAGGAEQLGALVKNGLPGRLLLRVNLGASPFDGLLIGLSFLPGRRLCRLRLGAGAFDATSALGQGALQRPKEIGAKEKIEKKNNDDRGHSGKKQLTELSEDLHRKQTNVSRLPSPGHSPAERGEKHL